MAYTQSTNVQRTTRGAVAWAPSGDDRHNHYRQVLMAMLPALAIISAAALFLIH